MAAKKDRFILVDDRQPDWMAPQLAKNGFYPHVTRLDCADFVWRSKTWGLVGLEDKTVSDLAGSRTSGRLDAQLRRMSETYDLFGIFLRGTISDWVSRAHAMNAASKRSNRDVDDPGGIPKHLRDYPALDNILLGRQLRGAFVVTCQQTKQIHKRLASVYDYLERPKAQDAPVLEAHFPYTGPMTDKAEVVYRMLAAVQGIRGKKEIAEKLAEQFLLGDILQWDESDWRVAGFTKKMAGRLALTIGGW
jgi:hypothetical protein